MAIEPSRPSSKLPLSITSEYGPRSPPPIIVAVPLWRRPASHVCFTRARLRSVPRQDCVSCRRCLELWLLWMIVWLISHVSSSPPPATDSSSLRPTSANRMSSQSMHIMSPSDIVGPSPVTSNGTETTEIEDDATEEVRRASTMDEGPDRQRSNVSQAYWAESPSPSC